MLESLRFIPSNTGKNHDSPSTVRALPQGIAAKGHIPGPALPLLSWGPSGKVIEPLCAPVALPVNQDQRQDLPNGYCVGGVMDATSHCARHIINAQLKGPAPLPMEPGKVCEWGP